MHISQLSKFFFYLFVISIISLPARHSIPTKRKKIANPPMKIVLLDTVGRDKWLFKPFVDLLESIDWHVDYRSIDQLIDLGAKQLNLSSYKAVFFIFGFEFFKNMGKSPICLKIINLMHNYCKHPHGVVGLILPPFNVSSNINLVHTLAPIFENITETVPGGLLAFPNLDPNLSRQNYDLSLSKELIVQQNRDAFFYITNTFLSKPLETRPLGYHTTLNAPRPGISFYNKQIDNILQSSAIYLKLLPNEQQFSTIVKETFPYGLYWFNPVRNNHVFIAQTTIFSFSSISESFHFCPMDYVLRKEMNKAVQHMIWELTNLIKTFDQEKTIAKTTLINTPSNISLPWSISSQGNNFEDEGQPLQTHKIAWMETTIFEQRESELSASVLATQSQQQNQIVDYIFNANIDTIWLSTSPNVYFSPIARNKSNTERMLKGLGVFTQKLAEIANVKNKKLPKILIGFEIANNLYEPNLPRQCSVDLYGNLYQDLPAALDRSFWKNEIKKPLNDFLMQWKKHEFSHGIPISGIVLDLEMYCRKISGEFLTCMGFDQLSFTRFTNFHRLNKKHIPVNEKVIFLMNNKKCAQYFSFLEKDSEQLGCELKTFLNKKIPHCLISCYTPNILINWFYKGLYKGLSTKKQPLQLFTFNSEFQSHKSWFELHKLSVQHASVLLLSKIKEQKDFSLVDSILQHHHGIWFNRFSRMIEEKINDWGAIERPGIDRNYYQSFCDHIDKAR